MGMLKPGRYLMLGDEALAEGAIMAGCTFMAGYPITPASETLHHFARRSLEFPDRFYVQMEDEIGSMAAVIGASWAGAKAMTVTSGPGFSLMQENLSYAYMTETPCVVAVMQRGGPSTGQATYPSQQEFYQSRFGAHGDYEAIVLSPWSVQEMFDLAIRAFNLSEKYRQPVILLGDGEIAHVRESLAVPSPETIEIITRKRPPATPYPPFKADEEDLIPPMPLLGEGHDLLITGSAHDERGFRNYDPTIVRPLVERLVNKIRKNVSDIAQWEKVCFNDEESRRDKTLLISHGVSARMAWAAAKRLTEEHDIPTDLLRLQTLWPIDDEQLRSMLEQYHHVCVIEMNVGQLVREIERLARSIEITVHGFAKPGGELFTSQEIVNHVKKCRVKKG